MINNKTMSAVAISVAVIAASVAAIIVTNNRSNVAAELARTAEDEKTRAASAEREAELKAKAERSRENIARAEAKKAEDEAVAAKAKAEAEQAEAQRVEDERKIAEANATEASAKSRAAEAVRQEAKDRADEAKAKAEAVRIASEAQVAESNAVAQASADTLAAEKLRSEKVIAEARLLELQQTDFESWQRNLLELEQDLAERERALTPDKTSADLTWVADREADVLGCDTNAVVRLKKAKVMPEDDVSIPVESRRLARAERVLGEDYDKSCSMISNRVVNILQRLYVNALKEGRVIDAQYYRRSIKYYYPNWEYKE